MATPKPKRPAPRDTDRLLRERIALAYAPIEPRTSKDHIEFLRDVFRWVKTGHEPGEKPKLEVHEGGKNL